MSPESAPQTTAVPRGITVTVGPEDGMFRGADHFAIQGALDYASALGGGIVRILPGLYTLRNALRLPAGTTLRGYGAETVLRKADAVGTTLTREIVWYERLVEVEDTRGFAVGIGISIDSPDDVAGRRRVSRHTILAIEGRTLHLDRAPGCDHRPDSSTRVVSLHSLVDGLGVRDVSVSDLTLDGNSAANPLIRGDYASPVFFKDVRRGRIERVAVRDWNGDGISWQTADDITVSGCRVEHVSQIAIHPGSGSSRSRVAGCQIEDCEIGIYWCWGVTESCAENNMLKDCRMHGTSLGYRDTDITLRRNRISHSGQAAILFREEGENSAHRAVIEENTIDCRPPGAARGIALCAGARDVAIRRNEFLVLPGAESTAFDASSGSPSLSARDNTFIVSSTHS